MTTAAAVRRIGLADIAREAGVSVPTVAKVVSGTRSNIRVSDATAQRIREIAERLQYRPNLNAKALAGVSIKMIGVLIDSQAPQVIFRMIEHIEKAAAAAGYRLMIGQAHDSPQNLFECFEKFQQSNVDGTIVLAHEYPEHEEAIRDYFRNKGRLVLVGENYLPEQPAILCERRTAVREALRALRESGRRRIGMYHLAGGDRYFGFRNMLATLKNSVDDLRLYPIRPASDSEGIGERTARALEEFVLPEKLDAVFVPNDFYAVALLQQLHRRNIQVPRDIAVVGWDNEPFSPFLLPALSTVDEHVETLGRHAFSLLKQVIDAGGSYSGPVKVEVAAQFIKRDSI